MTNPNDERARAEIIAAMNPYGWLGDDCVDALVAFAAAEYRRGLDDAAKVAESEPSILSGCRSGGSFGAARADQCRIVATAIRALSSIDGEGCGA
ncbi:MAG: hypothetical protein M3Y22_18515 [Pseudomonadota bacterium]|nr:hypothetical protein [Pseudomonadota bacterium]